MDERVEDVYEVVVVGGGAAGLSGAVTLARARRSVLVVDAGEPRNAPANGVHGLLGREGTSPGALLERGRAEARSYGAHVVRGRVRSVEGAVGAFVVHLEDGRTVEARRVLVTTGLVDQLPAVPGLAERWGRDVLHCPYCHGWEVRDRPIGVLATGPMSVHQALMFSQWSPDVVYFANGLPLETDQVERLAVRGVEVVTGEVAAVETVDDALRGVRLVGGELVERRALAVAGRMVARVDFLAPLGLVPEPHPSGMGEHLPADATGRSAVAGVWVAGNATDVAAQVGAAGAAGTLAAAQINADLITSEIDLVLADRRAFSAGSEREAAARRRGGHGL
ncbi:NAD(P)/FAD-dependent oxidoreductase [Nocardiopsis sp. MG754419]|uniref:NAD(P)/FAD-dependent oxidoreductase n=1 Tax=Nocardiopsis sp. MG754419 TaxID=2259865 RepID=UPI001BA75484|nr:NAD(P)/FAD-dependent oxidoreductase [Nocardiopsis sp. MG754419]MBR8743092.1 thioredoxin reductase [Nocardiopsis sp. MG754419]